MTVWVSIGLSGKQIATEQDRSLRSQEHATRVSLSLLGCGHGTSIIARSCIRSVRLAAISAGGATGRRHVRLGG